MRGLTLTKVQPRAGGADPCARLSFRPDKGENPLPLSPRRKRILRATLIVIPIVIGAIALLLHKTWKGNAVWLHLTGRASTCSLIESFEAADLTARQDKAASRIDEKTRFVTKDASGFSHWDTPRGLFGMVSNSRPALVYDLAEQECRIYGDHENGERRGDVVVDCGANVGVYTKTALANGAKLVVAIEPGPENLECLRRNLAREIGEGKVIVVPKGVWDKSDVLTLNSDPNNSARDSLYNLEGPGIRQIKVELTTIDKLVTELGLHRVDFIKMDIEGAEEKALLGARETIKKFRPRMAICTYHQPEDPVQVPKEVRSIEPGYRVTVRGRVKPGEIVAEVTYFSPR